LIYRGNTWIHLRSWTEKLPPPHPEPTMQLASLTMSMFVKSAEVIVLIILILIQSSLLDRPIPWDTNHIWQIYKVCSQYTLRLANCPINRTASMFQLFRLGSHRWKSTY
jgi:hypothetical protein